MSVRTGATLMKSVSIFLTSGRKASANTKRQISAASGKDESLRRRRRRKMPEGGGARNSAYIIKVIESLKKKTRFSRVELDSLCKLYKKLTTNSSQQQVGRSMSTGKRPQSRSAVEGIDRSIFRELLHSTFHVITEDTLVERLFCCWDREIEGAIRLEPWIMGLDVFLRGSLRDKIIFCFHVYDLNNDGYITKDEIFQLLKNCLIKQPGEEDPDEGVKDLSEMALKKLDVDHDGKISFRDYEMAIKEEPLLLEAFGQCLPTEESCASFLAILQPHIAVARVASAQEHPGVPIIENKNINIVVNVNAQELAKELCKIIESRLNDTDHVTSSKSIMKDLEEAVIPLVSPTRRGTALPSAFQVASHLDEITRRALTRDAPSINMLDEEIMTRDIVADMMASIKVFLSKQPQLKKNSPYRRMLHRPVSTTIDDDNEQDDYMNIRIKMNRKDILDALH